MKPTNVTVMGPDDLGRVVLADDDANEFPLVTDTHDYFYAARLLGWRGGTLDEAIDHVTEMSGEEITAPPHVIDYFEHLRVEREREDADDND